MPRPIPLPPPPRPVPPRQSLLLEGELKPADAEMMSYYVAYTVVVESFSFNGYPDYTMTFYPRMVCNDMGGCPPASLPPPSALEIRSHYEDACSAGVFEAFDMGGYVDDIQSAALTDSYGSACALPNQLTVDVTHSDGRRELLTGYRTY